MFQATRQRLTLWYALVTAVLMLLFACGVYAYVRATLIDRVDDTLKHVVEVVERSLVFEREGAACRVNVEASFRDNAPTVAADRIDLEWFDAGGERLWSTLTAPEVAPLHPEQSVETVRIGSEQLLRQIVSPVRCERALAGYLRASHPWFEVTKPIRQLGVDLALFGSATAFLVAAIGWFLSGKAIAPVVEAYQGLKQFTADASHELRNPIATIQTNVQMALTYPDADPQQQPQAIERLTQRLGRRVNDLLFLARSDSGTVETKWEAVPLDALLIEIVEEQQVVANRRDIYLALHLVEPPEAAPDAEDTFTLWGDWDQLARLFTNLIGNAIQHLDPQEQQEAAIAVELQVKNGSAPAFEIQVRDTGRGIAPEDVPHLFDRFYRVQPWGDRSAGAGLGLAIARAIVENHRGQIRAESELGVGTTFVVTLPALTGK